MALGYDPIRALMDEHQIFLARMEKVRETWRRSTRISRGSVDLSPQVAEFARFLGRDVGGLHASKEEAGLFPVLGRYLTGEGSLFQLLAHEHEVLRDGQRALERHSDALICDPGDDGAISAVSHVLGEVDSVLSQHIVKEEFVLFPMAQERLSRGEMAEVAQVFLRLDREYQEAFARHPESPLPSPVAVHEGSGALTPLAAASGGSDPYHGPYLPLLAHPAPHRTHRMVRPHEA